MKIVDIITTHQGFIDCLSEKVGFPVSDLHTTDHDPQKGAFSEVHRLRATSEDNLNSQDIVFRFPRNDADIEEVAENYLEHLKKRMSRKQLPGVMPSFGIFAVIDPTELVSADQLEMNGDIQWVFEVQKAFPECSTQLLQLLSNIGLETIQTEDAAVSELQSSITEVTTVDRLRQIYQDILMIMKDIHNLKPEFSLDEELRVYKDGLKHVVTDKSRFDGVAAYFPSESEITQNNLIYLRTAMLTLSEMLSAYHARVSVVHADAWASNFFVDDDNVYCIDPGDQEYSDPALDIIFLLTDLVFADMNVRLREGENKNSFSGQYVDLAEELLIEYEKLTQDDGKLRQVAPLFYAYKAFVSAVFDAGGNDKQRTLLIDSAIGVVANAIEGQQAGNDPLSFSYQDLHKYANLGKLSRSGANQL